MMNDKEKIIYTAKDIEQYLAGNLSAQQMHAMEKAALDDPFLAEAMEGYEALQNKEWNNHLVSLREEIKSKGTVAKIIPLHKSKNNWWKAAAAVLIIGSGAVVAILFNNNKEEGKPKPEIAQLENIPVDTAITVTVPATSVTQTLNPSASVTPEEKNKLPGSIAQLNEPVKITVPAGPQLAPVSPATATNKPENDVAAISPATPSANAGSELSKEMIADKSKAESKQNDDLEAAGRKTAAPAKREAVLNNFFTAQVVGADNTPLPFTNISIKKENFGTYADAKGMVRLVSTDSILQIEVKSVGYQPKTFALRNNQPQTKIILQEDETAYRDKIVIGNGEVAGNSRSRRATLLKDSVVNVEPSDGWDNYNTYVANNLDIPESKLTGNVHGEVEITFDVKSNGTVSNIRVNKSLGAEYDEAAKRLILEGPQWKVKKGRKTSASIKLKF
ncbi:MAG: carboxypeptidase-like regulatory domain-containing protein [Ferruginibacter sp.]|nr:carboxypeptidase-like regulatory domain-containing protein [Ferruginibacter sp.]